MPTPLTRRDLVRPCSDPSCTHGHENIPRRLHGRCHPRAPTQVCYFAAKRVVLISCSVCTQTVVEAVVAAGAIPGGTTKMQSLCHGRGFHVWHDNGNLLLRCSACDAIAATIAVAESPSPASVLP